MKNLHEGSLNPLLFGIALIALASIAFVIMEPQIVLSYDNDFVGGSYRGGIQIICDLDINEAEKASDITMAGTTGQNGTIGNTTAAEFMSIQTTKSGSISQINETAYTIELNNVANETILFSGRPDRVVKTVSTSDFIGNWTTGQDSFSLNPPNDVLIVEDALTGELKTFIVESFNPVYDMNTDTLTYTVVAENATSIDLPIEFGPAVLVTDESQSGIMNGQVI